MKNIFLPGFIALSLILSATSCDSDNDRNEYTITRADLPKQADSLVAKYFPNATYVHIKKNIIPELDGSVYDVFLSNNFEIEFDGNGDWVDIDGNHQAIPLELIPEKINSYVIANYPNTFVTSIDNERLNTDVELSNNIELIFDAQGNFIRIDR